MILTSIVVFIITSFAVYLFLSIIKSFYHPVAPQTQARRIHADECSICLENVRHETQASCGHVFCGECILAICERSRRDSKCPLCRNPITILFPNFKENMNQEDGEAKSVLEKIDRFNVMHSTDATSVISNIDSSETIRSTISSSKIDT
jgi:hypothetical protein